MSTDLAVACQGSGLAQRHGPCPCQGGAGTETWVPWAVGNSPGTQPGALQGARKSHGCLGPAGQASCQPRPMSPAGTLSPGPGPRRGSAIGQRGSRSRAPCSSRWRLPHRPSSPCPAVPTAPILCPRRSTRAPTGHKERGAGEERGQEHKLDPRPCLGLLLHGLCGSGALHPNPPAITDSPGQGSLSSLPHPGHPPLSQQLSERPWMGLQGPCPVTQTGRLSPPSQGTAPSKRLPHPRQGNCACGQWPSASHLYVSQQLLLAAAYVLQLLALLRGQVTGH